MEGISVKYVDHFGDDFRVFEAAKATLGGSEESGFNREETDPTRLVNFLVKNKHWTPLRHPHITFECEAPIAIARQLGKHQTGLSWNERSMRYKDSVIDVFVPDMFRGRPDSLHDGSTDVDVSKVLTELHGFVEDEEDTPVQFSIEDVFKSSIEQSVYDYEALVSAGLAPEQARFVLPQGMITRWVWTGSLFAFWNVYKQRISDHAQYETRDFAQQLGCIMEEKYPIVWTALKEHDLNR